VNLRKFRFEPNLLEWTVDQLEEELDATNPMILKNNITLITVIGVENFNIDNSLVNIITSDDVSVINFCLGMNKKQKKKFY
jgi:hypothetical protein